MNMTIVSHESVERRFIDFVDFKFWLKDAWELSNGVSYPLNTNMLGSFDGEGEDGVTGYLDFVNMKSMIILKV